MWAVIGNLVVTIIIGVIEVPLLLQKRLKRELITFSLLLFIAFTLASLTGLDLNIPNPMVWINNLFGPISKGFFKWFGYNINGIQ